MLDLNEASALKIMGFKRISDLDYQLLIDPNLSGFWLDYFKENEKYHSDHYIIQNDSGEVIENYQLWDYDNSGTWCPTHNSDNLDSVISVINEKWGLFVNAQWVTEGYNGGLRPKKPIRKLVQIGIISRNFPAEISMNEAILTVALECKEWLDARPEELECL